MPFCYSSCAFSGKRTVLTAFLPSVNDHNYILESNLYSMDESLQSPVHQPCGPICWVTMATPDLDRSARAWEAGLNLLPVMEGKLEQDLAQSYDTPELAGAPWILLGGQLGGVRLIEINNTSARGRPLSSLGWAAVEFSVTDLDLVISNALSAGFDVLGHPRALGSNPSIRAAQLAVPGGGAVYLTDIQAYEGPLDLHRASQLVDRAFIAVLASGDLERDRGWLAAEGIGQIVTDRQVKVPVLEKSLGLKEGQEIRISSLQLDEGCLVEIDAYPCDSWSSTDNSQWQSGMVMLTLASPVPLARGQKCTSSLYAGCVRQLDRLPGGALLERIVL